MAYHLTWVKDHPAWAKYLAEMRHAEFMAGTESDFQELNKRFANGITTWVASHMQAGNLKTMSRDVFLALLLGPCQEYARQWLAGYAVLEPDAAGIAMAEPIWLSLKGDKAGAVELHCQVPLRCLYYGIEGKDFFKREQPCLKQSVYLMKIDRQPLSVWLKAFWGMNLRYDPRSETRELHRFMGQCRHCSRTFT